MAHNTRIRADVSAWATVVLAADLNAIDQYCFEAINGDDGGTWAPSTTIIIGGSGVKITGAAIFDDLRTCHVKSGQTLTIDGGAFLSVSSTGTITLASGSNLDVESGADIEVKSGGDINLQSGGKIDAYGGSTVTWKTGSQSTQDAGATAALNGTSTVGATGTIAVAAGGHVTFADDGVLTLEGGGNWPILSSRSEWLPCRGDFSFSTPAQWSDDDGAGVKTTVNTAAKAYCRVGIPDHFTITKVNVRWNAPSHTTWPPQNLTTFSVYWVDGTVGGKTLLVATPDTSDQVTYESFHSLTLEGFSQVGSPAGYLLIEMLTESGTNAVVGSEWVSSEMLSTMTELRNG
jgi:hypothetical protein